MFFFPNNSSQAYIVLSGLGLDYQTSISSLNHIIKKIMLPAMAKKK